MNGTLALLLWAPTGGVNCGTDCEELGPAPDELGINDDEPAPDELGTTADELGMAVEELGMAVEELGPAEYPGLMSAESRHDLN